MSSARPNFSAQAALLESDMKKPFCRAVIAALLLGAAVSDGSACTNTGSFERWLAEFRGEAKSKGISNRALAALDGITLDPTVIKRDRGQSVFSQSFLEFSDRMAAKYR